VPEKLGHAITVLFPQRRISSTAIPLSNAGEGQYPAHGGRPGTAA
jgi:hypothetical protein